MTVDAAVALDALADLRVAFETYSAESLDAVADLGRRIRDLGDRVDREIQARRQELARAEEALRACESQKDGSCGAEAAAVARATERLRRAEAARRQIDGAVARWLPTQRRFSNSITTIVPEAQRYLSDRARAVEEYAKRSSGGLSANDSVRRDPVAPSASGGLLHPAGLPDGFALVPVDLIDDSDSQVEGPAAFHKGYAPEDLRWAYSAFDDVVLPALGRGLGTDYLRDRDQRERLQGTRSYSDTLSGFLDPANAIKLDRNGDGTYAVGNGYHRLWLARQMGRTHVPARIS